MISIPSLLVAASAILALLLGIIHLVYTFHGTKLHPRDPDVLTRMNEVSLVLTRQTTMWKAWIGFNASHSYGVILFGLIYGYLALAQSELLFHSPFLQMVGLVLLAGYALLAKLYWFSVPFRGVLLSAVLYIAAVVLAHV
jgi:hypothetical protein